MKDVNPVIDIRDSLVRLSVMFPMESKSDKDAVESLIRSGEYALALDTISYEILEKSEISSEIINLIKRLSEIIKIEKDPEYDGVRCVLSCRL